MTKFGIYLTLLGANLRSQLEYRVNFLVLVAVGLAWEGTGFAVIWIMLSRFQAISGWTLGQIAFLYGLQAVIGSLTFLAFSFSQSFEWLVRGGEFDRYLVRPLPPLLQLMASHLNVAGFGPLLGGVAIFLTANTMARVDWSAPAMTYLALTIAGGFLIHAAIYLAVASLIFRLLSTGMLTFVLMSLTEYGKYPLRIYPSVVQLLLTFGLPVAFIGYFPAAVLLGRTGELSVPPLLAYGAPLAGAIWFIPALLLFHRELRHYQSSGH